MNAEQYRAYCIPSNPLNDLGASTDWFDEITRLGVTHMHTLTLSGGTARTNYRLTADYRNAEGVDLRSDRREYGARASINHTTKDGLFTFSANISPRDIKRQVAANVFTGAIQNNPTVPVYDSKEKMGIIAFLQVAGYITLLNDLKKSRMIQKLTFWSGMLLQASIYFRYLIPKPGYGAKISNNSIAI